MAFIFHARIESASLCSLWSLGSLYPPRLKALAPAASIRMLEFRVFTWGIKFFSFRNLP